MRLGVRQRMVVRALVELERVHGQSFFAVKDILDHVWLDHQAYCDRVGRHRLASRAERGDPEAALALRIEAAFQARLYTRSRSRVRGSTRHGPRALERALSPARELDLLAGSGLIERESSAPGARVRLTEAARAEYPGLRPCNEKGPA